MPKFSSKLLIDNASLSLHFLQRIKWKPSCMYNIQYKSEYLVFKGTFESKFYSRIECPGLLYVENDEDIKWLLSVIGL